MKIKNWFAKLVRGIVNWWTLVRLLNKLPPSRLDQLEKALEGVKTWEELEAKLPGLLSKQNITQNRQE